MCGKQFHMLAELKTVITNRSPLLKKLSTITNQTYAFMFAKKGCQFSQQACKYMKENLEIPPDNICILDVEKSQLICATKWELLENKKDTDQNRIDLFNLWFTGYRSDTVPQVFLHFPHQWHFVEGGCNGLIGLESASATADSTQGSDLLHLLPLVREGRRTPPIQLKF